MGEVSKWIELIAIEKDFEEELLNLVDKRDKYFAPLSYKIKIFDCINLGNFDSEFSKLEYLGSHTTQVKSLNNLKSNEDKKVNNLESFVRKSKNYISQFIDKKTCFIYFFTVTKIFDKNSLQFDEDKANFLLNSNSKLIKNACYKEICNGPTVTIEKLVYIGQTTDIKKRMKGHEIFRKLHEDRYNGSVKTLYMASVFFEEKIIPFVKNHFEEDDFIINTPLEVVNPLKLSRNILDHIESMLIAYFEFPEYNYKDKVPKFTFTTSTTSESERTITEDPWVKVPFVSAYSITCDKPSIFFTRYLIDQNKRNSIIENLSPKALQQIKKKAQEVGVKF
ncbi:hypothetical protein [Priestia megaterium]|uniref:hypothetical protein n=1 Tax=Priestia megaterium TaxID=1404 RepID=UPI001C236573|nr:hypothetical protein [Priestia megaterium]MBU8754122.1 hypothetical protein [Priestia megaterium]